MDIDFGHDLFMCYVYKQRTSYLLSSMLKLTTFIHYKIIIFKQSAVPLLMLIAQLCVVQEGR